MSKETEEWRDIKMTNPIKDWSLIYFLTKEACAIN